MFRPQEISATDARKYFSQLIHKVQFGAKSFTIKTYRRPAVRMVREEYIAALEQVIGKKTINQILGIAGNENIPDFIKIEEIKKTFQRRLSGAPRPDSRPERSPRAGLRERSRGAGSPQQPKSQPPQKRQSVVAGPQPATPKPPASKSKTLNPRTSNLKPPTSNHSREILLLSNGKNYQ